ncbi:hypothetical protein IWZ01DRAFT_537422 [Phyllosticta capitalensis]
MSLTLPPRVPDSSEEPNEQQQPKYQTAIQQFKQLVVGVMEWTKRKYNEQYERWVPWLEDWYLKLFTKDNKASYATKDQLSKTKVSGNDDVDALQDDVHAVAANQLGQEGLARPVGDVVSKEGLNRAERGGKDENAEYVPGQGEAAGAAEVPAAEFPAAGVKDMGKGKGKGWFGRK